jgi:hypothetical protein
MFLVYDFFGFGSLPLGGTRTILVCIQMDAFDVLVLVSMTGVLLPF